jgi:hypothetical protein
MNLFLCNSFKGAVSNSEFTPLESNDLLSGSNELEKMRKEAAVA